MSSDRRLARPVAALLLAGTALIAPTAARATTAPPTDSTMQDAADATRLTVLRQIALAQALPRALRRARLLALAGGIADPTGVRGATIARALVADGDPMLAETARRRAALATGTAPAPTPTIVPATAAAPAFADPQATLAFSRTVLQRDPANADARRDAVAALLQLGDSVGAAQLAADAVAQDPNQPTAWVLAADVARSRNDTRTAMLDLQRAKELRGQELGSDTGGETGVGIGTGGDPGATTGIATAAPVQATDLNALPADGQPASASDGSYRTAQTFYSNPFRNQQQTPATAGTAATPAGASSDPLTRQIDSTLATLQQQVAPQVMAYLDITGRSGQSGLAGVGTVAVPMQATVSPNGFGKLKFTIRPTVLFGGRVGAAPLQQANFGTLALDVTHPNANTYLLNGTGTDYQRAAGVALDMDYAYGWFEGDIGTTPLGFKQQNVVGGITLDPNLTDDLNLRLVAERRAVTDSLLSYAGATDPRTGNDMGGVVRNRAYAQLGLSASHGGYYYAGVGYDLVRGENVEHNSEIEAGAGVFYPVWSSRTDEVRLGLNLVYFGFDKNLQYFTLGQGGYFSPQSYVAALIPVSYSERLGRLSYLVSGAVGVQTYHSNSSPFFPTNAALQAAEVARAAAVTGLNASYAGQSNTGISGNIHGEVQYQVTPNFDVGGAATFERAGDFDQGEGLVYARYIFDGVR